MRASFARTDLPGGSSEDGEFASATDDRRRQSCTYLIVRCADGRIVRANADAASLQAPTGSLPTAGLLPWFAAIIRFITATFFFPSLKRVIWR